MRRGLFPGSFDPVTLGHLDVIRRAAPLFDEFYVGVFVNPSKKELFFPEERVKMIQTATADLPQVRVIAFDGLLADWCRAHKIDAVVRGLRSTADFEYEWAMAQTNRMLAPETETVFLASSAALSHTSSSTVREIASFGGDISGFVPPAVASAVYAKYQERNKEG
ncbi:MAG: pantetheine-phosphate adenylyltransferase [Lachnospiraceae bacterium]|nr:pantetheine-phosphate adenylyltransferase [Lachnospiraceae bacterium]